MKDATKKKEIQANNKFRYEPKHRNILRNETPSGFSGRIEGIPIYYVFEFVMMKSIVRKIKFSKWKISRYIAYYMRYLAQYTNKLFPIHFGNFDRFMLIQNLSC